MLRLESVQSLDNRQGLARKQESASKHEIKVSLEAEVNNTSPLNVRAIFNYIYIHRSERFVSNYELHAESFLGKKPFGNITLNYT